MLEGDRFVRLWLPSFVLLELRWVVLVFGKVSYTFCETRTSRVLNLESLKDMEGNLIKTTYFRGTTNDSISEELRQRDLVLFSRPCSMMRPCGSLACLGTKLTATASQIMPYDHCAVVVLKRDGTPQLLEQTWSKGVQLRPYDLRIVRSLAETIVVRPLHFSKNEIDETEGDRIRRGAFGRGTWI